MLGSFWATGPFGVAAVVSSTLGAAVASSTLGAAGVGVVGDGVGGRRGSGGRRLSWSADWNISASSRRAVICPVPIVANGDAGAGFSRARTSSVAALMALSADEVCGIGVAAGKNSTVSAILMALVSLACTL